MTGRVRVTVHGSSANLGPGYDALAVALEHFTDTVEAWIEHDVRGVIVESIRGPYSHGIPVEDNTARRAAELVARRLGFNGGIVLRLYKGIPPGKGLGSSGASAAAGALAASALLGGRLSPSELIGISGRAEAVASGSPHYDNVSASLLGGFTIVSSIDGEIIAGSTWLEALFVVGVPETTPSTGKTRLMRAILPDVVPLSSAVAQWGRVALMVHAVHKADLRLLGKLMMRDEIVERVRARHVPCYDEVRRAAVDSGALGVALSGAGSSLIILAGDGRDPSLARNIKTVVEEAYGECGVEAKVYESKVGGGARVEDF